MRLDEVSGAVRSGSSSMPAGLRRHHGGRTTTMAMASADQRQQVDQIAVDKAHIHATASEKARIPATLRKIGKSLLRPVWARINASAL